MGYCTSYRLEILKNNNEAIDHEQNIVDASNECADFESECKWYEHEKEMKDYSKLHPRTLFELSGEGEEAGDLWIKYFLNGKVQECQAEIRYDDFNPEKLV